MVVMKFGGTSVATSAGWRVIAERIAATRAQGDTPVVVHSALAGVSNLLEDIAQRATSDTHYDALDTLIQQHQALGQEFALDTAALIAEELVELRKISAGIALLGEASPRQRARLMALGERMASRLGYAALQSLGVELRWLDARDVLVSAPSLVHDDTSHFLNASCDVTPDATLAATLMREPAVLTQGFVARDSAGETVVLGRGGSDTSASYLAALTGAKRVEIWTDVAGMFSADPRRVPGAFVLKKLDYAEAQEIASTGARVLHPRCIGPVRAHQIPLQVRSTLSPEAPGTLISAHPGSDDARLKAVSMRKQITLVSMETAGMWQQPGFLARAFALFAKHQLSIDLMSSSETSVTVSLDGGITAQHPGLRALTQELETFCGVTLTTGCAAISLVGRRVRAILHELAPAFDVFREFEVHLVSQAANDLNFTFVVNEEHGDKLVQRLHDLLIHRATQNDAIMGSRAAAQAPADTGNAWSADAWWVRRRDELLALAPPDKPVYVYDRACVEDAARKLKALQNVDRLLYSTKANGQPEILRALADRGVDLECVSAYELQHVMAACPQLNAERFLLTPNFAPRREYEVARDAGVTMTIDNRFVLEAWPEVVAGQDILLRVDPGQGRGHHRFVRTAGKRSKFGVPLADVAQIEALARKAGARVIGLHAHKGSGIVDASTWAHTARTLAQAATTLEHVRILNLGGGLGIPDTTADPSLDLDALDQHLAEVRADYPKLQLWLEPGRFLVAASGVLLTRVTQLKDKDGVTFVGVNTGMNSLIRPALYGAHHLTVNLTRLHEASHQRVDVVGPICESADVLGKARLLPDCREGDVIMIANVGAYGRVMSSDYNHRPPGDEIVI